MIIQKKIFFIFLIFGFQSLCGLSLAEQFQQVGYLELCDTVHGSAAYDSLYASFDQLIEFLQANPRWAHKLYSAKERFIRSKDKHHYSTDFFGFYDESEREGRSQISFYYSTHFHEFICLNYPEFNQVQPIMNFLHACHEIQKPYVQVFQQTATQLGLANLFSTQIPILLKVIKYLPSYRVTKPHYDGTAFSLFLDSTDNQSLLMCPYRLSYDVNDFSVATRRFSREHHQNSVLLIPGTLLAEFSIFPTPHIVMPSGKTRYATIAFAMRPNYTPEKNEFSHLPIFNH